MYRKYLNLPIQTKLLSIAAVIMLITSAIIFIYYPNQQRMQAIEAMQARIERMAEMMAFGVGIGLGSGDFASVSKALDWAKQEKDLSYIAILDEDGEEIAVTNPDEISFDYHQITSDTSSIQIQNRLFKAVPIEQDGNYFGRVILGYSLQEVEGRTRQARMTAFAVGLSLLIVFTFAFWIIRKTILFPVIKLQKAAALVAKRHKNVKVDVFANDEVGALTKAFNDMVVSIEKAQQELQDKNEKILATQEQLIVQEKMASLGQLTAGIAHEIKNPLNFVTNFAEGAFELTDDLQEVLDRYKANIKSEDYDDIEEILAEIRQNFVDIHDNGKRADRIVRSMMDHARGTKSQRQAVDIHALIDESINLAYHGYRAIDSTFNVDFQKNYCAALTPVEVIPQDLNRVLLNVITNACYAVHEKKKEQGESYAPMLTVSTKALDGVVEIHIRDNGNGIPQEILDKIFNPFFTTKPTGAGNTGLGLSISYDIVVHQHRGKLEVESEPGAFTEFVISLPHTTEDTKQDSTSRK